MLLFESTFPVAPATLNVIAHVCATSIVRYLLYPAGFDMLSRMRDLASNDDTERVVHCVLALVVKWTVVGLKLEVTPSSESGPTPLQSPMLTKEPVDIATIAIFAKLP